jgi:hypothetical protein
MVAPLRDVSRWSVPSIVVALAAAPLSACFYVDPINERPSAEIRDPQPSVPYRGDMMRFMPEIYDPDGDPFELEWRAYACTADACDDIASATATSELFEFPAPKTDRGGAPAT